jgi:hypothetical protein
MFGMGRLLAVAYSLATNFVVGDMSSQVRARILVHMVSLDLVHHPVGI